MFKPLNPFVIGEKDREKIDLANWIWNSHNWIEEVPGYYKCTWCNSGASSYLQINVEAELCSKNPAVMRLKSQEA